MNNTLLKEFTKYINDYYGENGIFESNKSVNIFTVEKAVRKYVATIEDRYFEGDSWDRDLVAEILFRQ